MKKFECFYKKDTKKFWNSEGEMKLFFNFVENLLLCHQKKKTL